MVVTLTEASGFKASDGDPREYVSFKRWMGDTSRVYVGIYKYSWTNTTKKINDYDSYDHQTCCVIFTHFQKGSKIHGFSSFHVSFFFWRVPLLPSLIELLNKPGDCGLAPSHFQSGATGDDVCRVVPFCDVFFVFSKINEKFWQNQKFDNGNESRYFERHDNFFVGFDVQVPHVLDLGKKTNHAQQKRQNAKWKGIRIFQVSKSSSWPQKKDLCFLQGRGVLSETHAVPQQLLGCHDLWWYCGQHPGRNFREKSLQIMCFHCDLRKLQLFPLCFWKNDGHQIKRERFPL